MPITQYLQYPGTPSQFGLRSVIATIMGVVLISIYSSIFALKLMITELTIWRILLWFKFFPCGIQCRVTVLFRKVRERLLEGSDFAVNSRCIEQNLGMLPGGNASSEMKSSEYFCQYSWGVKLTPFGPKLKDRLEFQEITFTKE